LVKQRIHRCISFLLLLLFVAAAYGGLTFYAFLSTPASDAPREFVLSIAPGAGFDRVAHDLKKEGAVTDVALFRILARLEESLSRIKAGDYLISTGWTPAQVLRRITGGKALLYRLSVREGLTWWETAASVEQQGFARFEDFRDVIRDPEFLRAHNIPFVDAEGFLFPETYLLPRPPDAPDRRQAEKVASHMVKMFWKKTEALWKTPAFMKKNTVAGRGDATATTDAVSGAADTAPASVPPDGADLPARNAQTPEGADLPARNAQMPEGTDLPVRNAQTPDGTGVNTAAPLPETPEDAPKTPAEVDGEALRRLVILASLVERETGLPEERGPVAGVFANRLRLGMLLQCDPTIIYGIGENFKGRIRRSQIDDGNNPYNTYRHAGLPPGPICSPGLEALKAAFAPTGHDFLFFVANGAGDGHNFSKTLDEHNRAVQLYRARPRGDNNP
jgi:cell division protein YceG involved in septum cleavage